MDRTEKNSFKEIPISAAIMSVIGQTPIVKLTCGSNLAEFVFDHDDRIPQIVMDLASGKLMINAADYEKARAFLYRKARLTKGGRGL